MNVPNFRKIDLVAYKPGRSFLSSKKKVIKLSANESAFGAGERVRNVLKNKNNNISKYPDSKFKKLIEEKDNLDDSKYFKNHIEESEQNILISKLENINRLNYVTKPYRIILLEANIPDQWKVIALKKLSMLENMDPTIGEYFKLKNYKK